MEKTPHVSLYVTQSENNIFPLDVGNVEFQCKDARVVPGTHLCCRIYNHSAISDVYGFHRAVFHVLIKATNTEDKN